MLIRIRTASLCGVSGYPVDVETDLRRGMPEFSIVGLADLTIRESCKRVRPAIQNSGYDFPVEKLTVNLMPASRPKEGSHFDLPIALSIIMLGEGLRPPDDIAFLGEVSLDGKINPISGALPLAITLRRSGVKKLILPRENAEEVAVLDDMEIYGARSLEEVVNHLTERKTMCPFQGSRKGVRMESASDYDQVIGQEGVKRAMVIAAAGNHGVLMIGSPGCGKTMIARRLPSIMPSLSYEEQLEVTGIYSVAGLLDKNCPVIANRPFRSPHHSITLRGLIGGGVRPRPGELSLAHRGVLFLDELGEFDGKTIDALRQPVEEGVVRIMRNMEEVVFPSEVMLVVASNPCKCGNLWDDRKLCTCSQRQLNAHHRKLMGPFSDRIDMHIPMMPVDRDVIDGRGEGDACLSSAQMRKQVDRAQEVQRKRNASRGYRFNSGLDEKGMKLFCSLGRESRKMMAEAYEHLGLSMRAYGRILRLGRTIADLEGKENIEAAHIAEALAYRPVGSEEESYGKR